jgi:hypothetical protein
MREEKRRGEKKKGENEEETKRVSRSIRDRETEETQERGMNPGRDWKSRDIL